MGGNLLHLWNLPPKRINIIEYNTIADEIEQKLLTKYARAERFRTFKSKIDFGDLDVLCDVGQGHPKLLDTIKELFHPNPHKNGQTISFPYNGFQVDVVSVGNDIYDIARDYFAYEVGMAMGVIANSLGLQFGWDGLHLKYPFNLIDASLPKHESLVMCFEKDSKRIFQVLGFDYDQFNKGFDTKEDFFEWVSQSHYFSPSIFNLDELNHQNRTRNSKRPTYTALVEFVKNKQPNSYVTKSSVRDQILDDYPFLCDVITHKSRSIIIQKERAAKFNGNIVKQITNLSGPELGKFIVNFKSKHNNFDGYVDSISNEQIQQDISEHNRQRLLDKA